MSLDINSFITAQDFNNLKDRVEEEVKRRSKAHADGQGNLLYGNDYNNDVFTSIPNIDTKNKYDIILASYLNQLLPFFNNFVQYPGTLNSIYNDANVSIGDIIYKLQLLITILNELNSEERILNNDCRDQSCMGLCSNDCNGFCQDGCTSCTNECAEGCNSNCRGTCKNDGCTSNCGGNCWNQCGHDGCTGSCSGGCNGQCQVQCFNAACYSAACDGGTCYGGSA